MPHRTTKTNANLLSGDLPEQLRVALVSTQQDWGGGEVYLSTLGQGLRKAGANVQYIARQDGKLQTHADDDGFEVRPIYGRGKSPRQIWQLRQWLCQDLSPVILHCNDSHALTAAGTAALGLAHVRVVGMRHTMFPIRSITKYHCLADQVICVSHAVADACARGGIAKEIIQVIHAAVDVPTIDPTVVGRLRQELRSHEWQKLIVAVGNLLDCKGHSTLIDAAALVAKDHDLRIVIAGQGPLHQTLENQIRSLGLQDNVKLLGFRNDANELMAAADLVVHPSFDEGLCLTVAAAMMLGTPVVATAVGGLCEVLAIDNRMQCDQGPFASDLQPGNPTELANAIDRQLTADADDSKILAAQQFAIDHFNAQRMVQDTIALYHSLLPTVRQVA